MGSIKLKPIKEVRIQVFANGQIRVQGETGDFIGFLRLMNYAEKVVMDAHVKKMKAECEEKPDIKICGHLN